MVLLAALAALLTNYPRMQGDDLTWACPVGRLLELPPHAGGRCLFVVQKSNHIRITPARRGTMNWESAAARENANYPRTQGDDGIHCQIAALMPNYPRTQGDDLLRWWGWMNWAELPPHAGGRFACVHALFAGCRITPARRGTMSRSALGQYQMSNYPRTQGDDACQSLLNVCVNELPPHAGGRSPDAAHRG